MSTKTIDQQFVEYVVKSLVGDPDAVIVERIIDEKGVLLTLTVSPDDLGRVIGKRGATAQSLRTLLRALGTKNEARYNLKIVDNGEPREERSNGTVTEEAWTSKPEPVSVSTTSSDDMEVNEEDAVARTRRELEDLDDLDV